MSRPTPGLRGSCPGVGGERAASEHICPRAGAHSTQASAPGRGPTRLPGASFPLGALGAPRVDTAPVGLGCDGACQVLAALFACHGGCPVPSPFVLTWCGENRGLSDVSPGVCIRFLFPLKLSHHSRALAVTQFASCGPGAVRASCTTVPCQVGQVPSPSQTHAPRGAKCSEMRGRGQREQWRARVPAGRV